MQQQQQNPIAGIAAVLSLIGPITELVAKVRERRAMRRAAKAAQANGSVPVPAVVDRAEVGAQVATVMGSAQLIGGAALETVSQLHAINPLSLPPELAEAPFWAQALHVFLMTSGALLIMYRKSLKQPKNGGLQL
jgi:hypothetical protein